MSGIKRVAAGPSAFANASADTQTRLHMYQLGGEAGVGLDADVSAFAQATADTRLDIPGDVHVWRFTTDRPAREIDHLQALLSDRERERAARFRFEEDRSRFIARRGLLRVVLGLHSKGDPARIAFELNAFGKPTLISGDSRDWQFSASHSSGIGLVAVTVGRAVGVDIERHRADVDCLGVAASFFASDEVEALRRADPPLRRAMFFTLWSCKEAWVKARGLGLSFPLDRCRVEVTDGAPRLLEDPEQPGEHTRWSLTPLDVDPECSGALVVAA